MFVSGDYIYRVFDLDLTLDEPIDVTLLANEYTRLEEVYKRWRLSSHKPKDGENLRIFDTNEKPPFDVEAFKEYFRYTYYSICQILSMEPNPLMSVLPMILTAYVQTHDARSFNYVSQIVDHINHVLERIKNNPSEVHFRHYSMLMHMLLYVGQGIHLWTDNLRVMEYDRQGLRNHVQMWTTHVIIHLHHKFKSSSGQSSMIKEG